MKSIAIISFISILFLGCEPGLVFQEAVPPGMKNLTEIPEFYRGAFVCTNDSTHVYVTDQAIIEEYYHRFVTTIDKIDADANCVIVGRGIHFKEEQVCVPFEYISDERVTGKLYRVDTLFSINEKHVVRQYKGNLFFNYQLPHGSWTAVMLNTAEDGSFTLRILDMNEDISQIKEASTDIKTRNLKDDKVQYILNPTLIEFENITKKPNRAACDKFIRLGSRLIVP